MNSIPNEDVIKLRRLAKTQLEYANLPVMKQREKAWHAHNDLQGDRPMIHMETWTFEKDILPQLECQSADARSIELHIQREILNHEVINDDKVVKDFYGIEHPASLKLFNIDVKTEKPDEEGLGHQFIHAINNFPDDMKTLEDSTFNYDDNSTTKWVEQVNECIGDILPVRLIAASLCAVITQKIVHFMGMENMFMAMMDHPQEFHEFTNKIAQVYISFFKWMEKQGLLSLNNGNNLLIQGSFGFSNLLPKSVEHVTTNDMWGYMDSQETSTISPDMFEEFFFPYYNKIASNFGRLSYGCCEPVHDIWDSCISKLPNLAKVSISPWCNETFMGERLRGTNVIYHRKPSPNFLGVGNELDVEAFKKHITNTLTASKGCALEFGFRDIYTLSGNKGKPRQAVDITRNLIDEYWQ